MPPEYNKNVTFVEEQQMTRGQRSLYGRSVSKMARFLVARGIAQNESQANIILLGIAGIFAAIGTGIFWWSGGFGGNAAVLTPEQIQALEDPAFSGGGNASAAGPGPTTPGSATPGQPGDGSFDPSLYQRR